MALPSGLDRFRLDGGSGGVQLALSSTRYAAGVAANDVLAAITFPAGWELSLLSNFGGRVKIEGGFLKAVSALSATATGTAKVRAVSPDGRDAVEKTFDLAVIGATVRLPGNAKVYALGDSRTLDNYRSVYETMVGTVAWAYHRSKGRITFGRNSCNGVGGATTAEIRANQYPAAKASDAKILVLWAGVNSANTNATPASVIDDIGFMASDFCASAPDRVCIVYDEAPVSGLQNPATHVAVRNGIRAMHAPANGINVLRIWDLIATVPDGETPQAWAYRDGIHPGKRFANVVGKALWTLLDTLVPAFNIFAQPGILLAPDIDTDFTKPATTGVAYSTETVDGVKWLVVTVSAVTNLNLTVYQTGTAIPSGLTTADFADAIAAYKIEPGSSNVSVVRQELRRQSGQALADATGATALSGADMGSTFEAACGEIGPDGVDGLHHPPPASLGSPTVATQFRPWWFTIKGLPSQSCSAVVKFALPQLRKA